MRDPLCDFNVCTPALFEYTQTALTLKIGARKKIGRPSSPESRKYPLLVKSLANGTNSWSQSIKQFVKGFNRTHSMANFWQTIVHHVQGGSGQPDLYSGWLNAFIFWNESGDCLMTKVRTGRIVIGTLKHASYW
jgi:hypothetical protein